MSTTKDAIDYATDKHADLWMKFADYMTVLGEEEGLTGADGEDLNRTFCENVANELTVIAWQYMLKCDMERLQKRIDEIEIQKKEG